MVTVSAPLDPVANHVARDARGTISPPVTRDAMSSVAGSFTIALTCHLLSPGRRSPRWPSWRYQPRCRCWPLPWGEARLGWYRWITVRSWNSTYHDLGVDYFIRREDPHRRARKLIRQLEAIGYTIHAQPPPSAAA